MHRSTWIALALALAACGGGSTETAGGRPVVLVTEDVLGDTTWRGDTTYVVDRVIGVRARLTLEPGVIVKFTPDGTLHALQGGVFDALGAQAAPILFTSIRDDVGGDTNGDGTTTSPAPGDWPGIEVLHDGSTFARCEFRFAGHVHGRAVLLSARASVVDSTFRDTGGASAGYGALEAASALPGSQIARNHFARNAIPLRIGQLPCLDGSNSFGTGADANNEQAVRVATNTSVTGSCAWGETEVPYLLELDLWIGAAGTLSLAPGVVVKVMPGGFVDVADGGALALGTGAVFTSWRDDTRGGDTNGDGAATAPAVGDWIGVWSDVDAAWLVGDPYLFAGGPVET